MTDSNKSIVHKHRTIRTITELILYLFEKSDDKTIPLQHILHDEYGFSKSTIYYKIKQLERKKIIKSLPRTKPKFYYLVKKDFLKNLIRGGESKFRLHNLELSYKIIKKSSTPLREKWDLKRWCGSKERFGDVTARFTTKNLILYLQAYGRTPQESYIHSVTKANLVLDMIQNKHPDLLIDPYPRMNRKAHFSVPTPKDIKNIADNIQVSGKGWKIDKSEGEGEIEFVSKDPFELIEKASSFANMPDRIKTLEQINNNFLGILENQQKQLLSLQQITQGLQTSLQRIVSPFAGESFSHQKNVKQKSIKDYIEPKEELNYIG